MFPTNSVFLKEENNLGKMSPDSEMGVPYICQKEYSILLTDWLADANPY